jgi:hypothetical protein
MGLDGFGTDTFIAFVGIMIGCESRLPPLFRYRRTVRRRDFLECFKVFRDISLL